MVDWVSLLAWFDEGSTCQHEIWNNIGYVYTTRVIADRGVDPFFGLGGGGGGGKSKENFKSRNIKLCARRKMEICLCLVVFLC